MTKTQLLNQIKKHCKECPLKCEESCPLSLFKNGVDPTKKRRTLPKQCLDNLLMSSKRNGGAE